MQTYEQGRDMGGRWEDIWEEEGKRYGREVGRDMGGGDIESGERGDWEKEGMRGGRTQANVCLWIY